MNACADQFSQGILDTRLQSAEYLDMYTIEHSLDAAEASSDTHSFFTNLVDSTSILAAGLPRSLSVRDERIEAMCRPVRRHH